MADKRIYRRVFFVFFILIFLLIIVIVLLIGGGNPAKKQSPPDILLKLNSPTRYEREQTIIALRQMDPITVLEQFKRNYLSLYTENQTAFTEKVLPYLTGVQVDTFFLNEFREGLKSHEEVKKLATLHDEGKIYNYEILQNAKTLYQQDQWWYWIIRAKSNLRFVPTYEELYRMLIKINERGIPLTRFAQSLNKRDPNRSQKDFTNLLFEEDKQMKLCGIWALEAVKFVPEYEVIQNYFESKDTDLLDQSVQYICILDRQDINLLLSLIENPYERVGSMAEYHLGKITYLSSDEKNEILKGAETARQRAEALRLWWEQHKEDSEQALRNQAASKLIAKAEQKLTKDLLSQLAEFYENSEIYPVFNKALISDDIELRKAALDRLTYITVWKKNKAPIEIIINFFESMPLEECKEYAEYLAQIDDERARTILLKTLEIQRGENVAWRGNIARAMGKTGQNWVVEPLTRMIIEDGSSVAANVFSLVEGVDAAVPLLLNALTKEENHIKRYAILDAIKTTGDSGLPERLTKSLRETPVKSDSVFREGIRSDILSLMEIFPDPNSKSVLLDLLKSSNPWDVLGATRVLGNLGDDSGVEVLIKYIKPTTQISYSFYGHQIGNALQMVKSPKTKKLLENHFRQGNTEVKKLTLHVMAQQIDSAYISFFEKQLKSSNTEIASAASAAISSIVCSKENENEKQHISDFDIDILKESDLPPIKNMLLWAFFDTRIFKNHRSFSDHKGLENYKGAVLMVNRFQQIEFDKETQIVKITTPISQSDLTTSDGIKAGRKQSYAGGSVKRARLGNYMTIFLDINSGGASCLFKRNGKKWKVIGYVGGFIE